MRAWRRRWSTAALALQPWLPARVGRAARLFGGGTQAGAPGDAAARVTEGESERCAESSASSRTRRSTSCSTTGCCCCSIAARTPRASSPSEGAMFHMHKGPGYVRDVFRTRNMRELSGNAGHRPLPLSDRGLGVLRARGAAVLRQLAVRHHARPQRQPDQQRGAEARALPARLPPRQHQLRFRGAAERAGARARARRASSRGSTPNAIFTAVAGVHRRCRGAYAIVAMIAGYGMLAFRDPFGIRPLIIGVNEAMGGTRVHGRDRIGGARGAGLRGAARRRAGRGDLRRPDRRVPRAAVRRRIRCCGRASSSTSTSRGPIR